jgi:hypothetical protein
VVTALGAQHLGQQLAENRLIFDDHHPERGVGRTITHVPGI